MSETAFIVWNMGIAAGYFFNSAVLVLLAQRFQHLISLATLLAGLVFFATCALTHVEQVVHLLEPTDSIDETFLTAHMQVIHFIQMFAVWTFMISLLTDLKVRILG